MYELRATGTLPLPYGGWRMSLLVATATSLAGAALFAFLWCTRADAYEEGASILYHAHVRARGTDNSSAAPASDEILVKKKRAVSDAPVAWQFEPVNIKHVCIKQCC